MTHSRGFLEQILQLHLHLVQGLLMHQLELLLLKPLSDASLNLPNQPLLLAVSFQLVKTPYQQLQTLFLLPQ